MFWIIASNYVLYLIKVSSKNATIMIVIACNSLVLIAQEATKHVMNKNKAKMKILVKSVGHEYY